MSISTAIKPPQISVTILLIVAGIIAFSCIPYGIILSGDVDRSHEEVYYNGIEMWPDELWLKGIITLQDFKDFYKNNNVHDLQAYEILLNQILCLIAFVMIFTILSKLNLRTYPLLKFISGGRILFFLLPILFFTLALYVSEFLYSFTPLVQDSIAQFIHAKALASGEFFLKTPEPVEFFITTHMIEDNGKYYSQYPPGYMMLLAAGHLLNMPQIVNPLLGAATLVIIWHIGKELFGRRNANLSLLLAFTCASMVMMSADYMNSASSLFFASIFYLYYFRNIKTPSAKYGIITGIALGMLFLVRPYTAIAVATPFIFHGLYLLTRDHRRYLKPLILTGIIASAISTFYLYYNYKLTGSALTPGYYKLWGKEHRPGFGKAPWGDDHDILNGLSNTSNDYISLNFDLFRWPVPDLIFLAPVIFFLFRKNRQILFLTLAPLLSLSIFNFFYFFQANYFGPRFLYEFYSLLIPLISQCFILLPRISHLLRWKWLNRETCSKLLLLLIIFGQLNFWLGLNNYKKILTEPGKIKSLQEMAENHHLENAIVFIGSNYHYLAWNLPQNDHSRVIYARDLGEKNARLINKYPERQIFIEKKGKLSPLARHLTN